VSSVTTSFADRPEHAALALWSATREAPPLWSPTVAARPNIEPEYADGPVGSPALPAEPIAEVRSAMAGDDYRTNSRKTKPSRGEAFFMEGGDEQSDEDRQVAEIA
jgi:hypothetical protein